MKRDLIITIRARIFGTSILIVYESENAYRESKNDVSAINAHRVAGLFKPRFYFFCLLAWASILIIEELKGTTPENEAKRIFRVEKM